ALKTYFPVTIRTASYPNLLTEDIPGVAVKAFLVTYDYKLGGSVERLVRFARSWCQNFPKLQAEGHPKWREVQMALPELGRGWAYYAPMERELRGCINQMQAAKAVPVCTQQARVLGLCK
ncbi:MAG: C4-dicarboxylate ABC transporter substrate-binding protein, partial [Pseudomonadota bacterium]|nr:C4-dicarboxylate ABC transporter substrate-binding protein [Pseudomonadota bacterium]